MEWRLRPETQAAGKARRDAVRWLADQDVATPVVDDLALVIAELLANAIRVARTDVCLEIVLRDRALHVSVSDDGPGFATLPPEALPPLEAEGSRGLYLVRTLSRGFAVQSGRSGTTVRCWVPLSDPAALAAPERSASASPTECRQGP